MKRFIHARLSQEDRAVLEALKHATGHSDSQLVRRGLQLVSQELSGPESALERAGRSVGRFSKGPKDLSTNRQHLEDFGR
jgi:hypothetical protein